ncbi:TetR/AcrR family transcriptional regulator [Capnocytophaga gingivalis]|jgi:transcriptional regulator, tetR family|uniref:TetR/AcrR family transcriptional regulator n=1 Tax=Capnocytophaga gingivalis TaxID=1017 RepID=UPI0028D3EA1C|nr:TetR/AcrR family transcriptional regulator [Capnocytophaga gingivalis]
MEIIPRALGYFLQYGFKTFTMDDLAHNLGISKKTLYEQFASKQILVDACLDYALEMSCKRTELCLVGEGSVIENIFMRQKEIKNFFNMKSWRPLWELKRYFPKTYERMDVAFAKSDTLFIDQLIEKGLKEGFFRENINIKFYKQFYTQVQRLRSFENAFDEKDFPFWETVYTMMEYFFRIIVNEKGMKELERVLLLVKNEK